MIAVLAAYLLGIATLPALGALAYVLRNADPGHAWRTIAYRGRMPAWMAFARAAGVQAARADRLRYFSEERYERHLAGLRRMSREATRISWCPRAIYPRVVWGAVRALVVGAP